MDGAEVLTGLGERMGTKDSKVPAVSQSRLFRVEKGKTGERRLYKAAKRTLDVVVSFLGLLVLSVIFIGAALAIVIEDGGPVFYVQKRIGQNGREFKIYKFRSMRKNAEDIHEALREQYGCQDVSFKMQNDPRITNVGKIIRKFNIDELPQLLNILKGDMSLVGPRPLPVYEYADEQKRYGDKYMERYLVPQGLTCIWQISNRAAVDFEKRMQMDVEYAQKSGFWMDFKLIIKTFVFTVVGKAKY